VADASGRRRLGTIKEDRGMALLEVRGLEKKYGRRQVVNGVAFDVNIGEVVGLLGPNGAGKTTSFRMTIGLIDADGGSVTFDGRDVTRLPMYLRARAGMGYLAQDSSVFKQLSVENNLMAILETRHDLTRRRRKERQNELLEQFGLTKIRKTKAHRVSGGERRRLEIARSLITEPKLIMLDEPFAGIDPKTVAEIQDQIRNLVETYHIGILLTDHNIRETLQVTDRSYVIREGQVFAYGNPEEILNNPDVRRHYIGERFDVGHLLDQRRPVGLSQSGTRIDGAISALSSSTSSISSLPPVPPLPAASGPVPVSESWVASGTPNDDLITPQKITISNSVDPMDSTQVIAGRFEVQADFDDEAVPEPGPNVENNDRISGHDHGPEPEPMQPPRERPRGPQGPMARPPWPDGGAR
jgi:lipopolysaccharide export system ATP-binding protein